MPFICPACENKTAFYRDDSVTNYCSQTVYIDEQGDIQDWGDSEENDSETTEYGNEYCSECQTRAEEVNDDEWEAWNGPNDSRPSPTNAVAPKTWKEKYEEKKVN